MSSLRTRAVVLRRTNFGEADRIIQLLTPEGKKSVMAKGVRREKSKLAGGVELFAVTDVVIQQGKGSLGILTSARLVHFYRHIIEDYDRLQFGYEAIRLIAKASEMIDEPEWYDVMFEVLKGLDAASIPLQLTQAWFYLQYADLTGDPLSLQSDIAGNALDATERYSYDVSEKGLRRAPAGDITADHIKFLRLMSVKSLATIIQVGGVDHLLSECWQLARQHASIQG